MNRNKITSTPNIEGYRIVDYLGIVNGGPSGYTEMLDEVAEEATNLEADWVVSFYVQSSSPNLRVQREFQALVLL